MLLEEELVIRPHIIVSFAENKLSSSHAHDLFPVTRPLIFIPILFFKFIDALIINFLEISLGLHKLSILKVVIRFMNVDQGKDDPKSCHN